MSLFLCSIFKNRLYLINYARIYTRENLHNSKKNINFARFLSGKLVNVFSKILIIGHFVKSGLQNRQTVRVSRQIFKRATQRHSDTTKKSTNNRI